MTTLATNEQLEAELNNITNNWDITRYQDHYDNIIYKYPNEEYFCSWKESQQHYTYFPFSLPSNNSNQAKYERITGTPWNNTKIDFLYHWITNFEEINTFESIRKRITNPSTCGAFATTIAVNKYIKQENLSDIQIRDLLKHSKWQWKKNNQNDWIQKTIYQPHNYLFFSTQENRDYPYVINENSYLFHRRISGITTNSVLTLKPFENWLADQIEDNQPETREEDNTNDNLLMNHSEKATHHFSFKKNHKDLHTTFLGVELELENFTPKEFKNLQIMKEHAIFKYDGSLDKGVEICTAPATLDIHKKEFSKLFQHLDKENSNLEAKSSCGLHIHIDKTHLSPLHIANFTLFLNHQENNHNILQIAGRTANSYCKQIQHNYDTFIRGRTDDRYQRVNLTNEKTIELRMFASTTDYDELCRRLEFTQAVVDYTRPGATQHNLKEIKLWENFKNYVKTHPKFYPYYAKTI